MNRDNHYLEYFVLAMLVIAGIVIWLGVKNNEINFCRDVFASLAKGEQKAAKYIDWENFKALDIDVGATYLSLPNDKERQDYRKSFIEGCARGFSYGKGQIQEFKDWRIYDKDEDKAVIAVDYTVINKTILFTVSKLGARKLSAVQWETVE